MFRIREDQMAALAKGRVGQFLADDFSKAGARASYDSGLDEVQVSSVPGETARLALDSSGRVTRATTPLGRTFHYNFDDWTLDSVIMPNGYPIRFSSDEEGRCSAIERGNRRRYEFGYDTNGNLDRLEFPEKKSLQFKYSGPGLLREMTDRMGHVTQFDRDEEGALVRIVDPRGKETCFDYSEWDAPDRIEYADGSYEDYTYAPSGNLQRILYSDGFRAECEQDASGRLSCVNYEDGHCISFKYNESGKVVEATNPEISIRCEYDEKGRLISEDQGGQVVRYKYCASGHLEAVILPNGDTIVYEYDPDGRLSAIQDWVGQKHKFNYGEEEQPVKRICPNGLSELYQYNDASQLRRVELNRRSQKLWKQEYERDLSDRIIQTEDSRVGIQHFTYNSEGQVLRVVRGGESKECYSYDEASNRTHANGQDFEYDSLNRPVFGGGIKYSYDARGNRVSDFRNGTEEAKCRYNGQNLLIQVETSDGHCVEFAYDAFARRIRKTSGDITTRYLWAGHRMIQEIVEGPDGETQRDFLFFGETNQPLAMRVDYRSVYYYHCDQLGTPQLLTNQEGRVVWSAVYNVYGSVELKVSEVENPLRFPGQYFDQETQLHYNRARYYDPATGCYLSRDPMGWVVGANDYIYANGNPLCESDPLGLWGESWPGWLKATVSVAGAVVAGVAVGALAVALAPAALGAAVVTGIAIAAGGMAAGAAGFGLSAAMTEGACVWCEVLRGAGIGLLSSLPFIAVVPLGLGVLGYLGVGAASGAIGYVADWASGSEPWSTQDFLIAVGFSALTAGGGRWLGPRISNWWKGRKPAPKSGETSATKIGKNVHKKNADQRRNSGDWDLVNEPIRDPNGKAIEVPKRVDARTGQPSAKTQKAVPDAVKGPPDGVILDDKPLGRAISKDKQQIRRFIDAYEEAYGQPPKKIVIERYDPTTGQPAGRDVYSPEDFQIP